MNPKEGLKAVARNPWVQRGVLIGALLSTSGACARPPETPPTPPPAPTAPAQPKEIPMQTVPTPQIREVPPPAPTPKPKEVAQENPIKIFPTRFEIRDSDPRPIGGGKPEEGWKWIIVQPGFENASKRPIPVGLSWDQFVGSKVLTKEGFQYSIYDAGNSDFYCSYNYLTGSRQITLPPGFRIKRVRDDRMLGGKLDNRMCFKVARNTSGHRLQIPGFPEINLEQEIAKRNLRFPTDRPDSEFKEFGGSFEIPTKGTVTFIDVKRGEVKPPYQEKREVILLRTIFENTSQGYEQNFSLGLSIIDDEGIFYPSEVRIAVPPSLSKEATTIFPREINKGKLIVTGDLNEIFNVQLPDPR